MMKLKLSLKDAGFLFIAFLCLVSGGWFWGLLIAILTIADLDDVSDEDAFINIDTRKNNGSNDS